METLFNTDQKELSKADKLKKAKKITADLTNFAIDYLNNSGIFMVHRSNNTPSTRISKQEKVFKAFDENGNPIEFKYMDVSINFKKGNIKDTILDISGIRNDGVHIELEVKTGKDTLSDNQIERIRLLKSFKGISFAFKDKETFLLQIGPYMKRELAF